MADPTYADLLEYFRAYGQAAQDDVFEGITYWSDPQLEEILKHHTALLRVKMKGRDRLVYQVQNPPSFMFTTDVIVTDESGVDVVDPFTYDPITNRVTFEVEQEDAILFIDGVCVKMYEALADLWDQKVSQRVDYTDFRAGHNTMELSQSFKHCERQRDYYRNKKIASHHR